MFQLNSNITRGNYYMFQYELFIVLNIKTLAFFSKSVVRLYPVNLVEDASRESEDTELCGYIIHKKVKR